MVHRVKKKQSLHNYLRKGATFIFLVTAVVSFIGLAIDTVKISHISDNIIYINVASCAVILITLALFFFGKLNLPTSFAITVYNLVVNFGYAYSTISFGDFETILLLRNCFFFVYLMVLTYMIVNKANGIIVTIAQVSFIIFGAFKIGNPFLWDSLMLFVVILGAFSAVTYYLVDLFENNIHELLTKNAIIEKQNSDLNERNLLLLEKQQQIQKQSEKLVEQQKELSGANNELKALVATKDKFFSIIAHDLKNPLNSMMGYAEMLYSNFENFEKEKRTRMLELVYQSSKRNCDLIDNLLTWARTQTHGIKENLTKVNLYHTTIEAAEVLKSVYTQKEIKMIIDLDADVEVIADKYMLASVLHNLISNAIKFTDKNGTIAITAEKQINGFLKICVADTGLGIAEEDIPKLFRTDQHYTTRGTNQERGTGLGLILCKEFIGKNGGQIWVKSQENKGSQFYFTLPLYKAK